MRIGVIDLGTNSVRFDVRELQADGRLRTLHHEKLMIRLGQNAFVRDKLDPQAIRRTLLAFLQFKATAEKIKLHKVLAFGTAALREAQDREKLIDLVRRHTGLNIRVISGAEEAKLIALGVLSNERVPAGLTALVDIGGGSTEISICKGHKVLRSGSFPLGVARLQQLHLKRSPPASERVVRTLRTYIRQTLEHKMREERWPKVRLVIGSSGTVKALARLQKTVTGKKGPLTPATVDAIVARLAPLSLPQLQAIPRMELRRADLILAGAITFQECLMALGAKKAVTTQFSLRDGVFEEEVRLHRQGKTSHLAFHVDDLYRLSCSFGQDRNSLQSIFYAAESLFTRLRRVHKLPLKWQIYLQAALILRNIGEAVSRNRHPVHTYYLIKNSDLPPMEQWEVELIGQLCLFHVGAKVPKKLPEGISLGKNVPWTVFLKLLTLLRLLNALSPHPKSRLAIRSVRAGSRRVTVRFTGKHLSGLEELSVDQLTPSFRKVFGRDLSVKRAPRLR